MQRAGSLDHVERRRRPHRECVACGFTDTLNEQGLSVPKELGTRVNQQAVKAEPVKVQTVQFFPNPKLKKPSE